MKNLKFALLIVGLLSFAGCEYKADAAATSGVKTTKEAGKCGKDMKCGKDKKCAGDMKCGAGKCGKDAKPVKKCGTAKCGK